MTDFAEWLDLQEKAPPVPKMPKSPVGRAPKMQQTLRSKQMAFGPSAYYREPMGALNRMAFMGLSGIGNAFRRELYGTEPQSEPPAPGALPWPDAEEDEYSVTITGTADLSYDANQQPDIEDTKDKILHTIVPAYFANELKDDFGQSVPNWVNRDVRRSYDLSNPQVLQTAISDDGTTLMMSLKYRKLATTDRLERRPDHPYGPSKKSWYSHGMHPDAHNHNHP